MEGGANENPPVQVFARSGPRSGLPLESIIRTVLPLAAFGFGTFATTTVLFSCMSW
jgi:hypothetical protein